MPRFRDFSMPTQVSTIAVLVGYSLPFLATRTLGPASTVAAFLPFAYPVVVILLAWHLIRSGASRGWDRITTVPPRSGSLGLGAPAPLPLGHARSFTDQIAGSLGLLCWSGGIVVFPQYSGFPEALVATSSIWWLAAAVFITFGLPRLMRQAATVA